MIFNNLKIALRTLRKNKIYTGINIVGLAVGIAAALLLFQIVQYESSFNQNFAKHEQIVRVVHSEKMSDGEIESGVCTPIPAMDALENNIPAFQKMTRVREVWASLTVPGTQAGQPIRKFGLNPDEVSFFVENEFFEIFDLEWLTGDAGNALKNVGTVVLTKSWAEKCFDNWKNAVGKTVLVDNLIPVKVEGVVSDFPSNCDFPIQYLLSYETLKANAEMFFYSGDWGSCSSNNQVFALLEKNTDRNHLDAMLRKIGAKEYAENNDGVQDRFHQSQPLSDLHYNEDLGHSGTHYMSRSRLQVLSMIGLLIMIMACFNFINLATAQATLRAKEVGVRKTLGGYRWQLIVQFMTETSLVVLIAVLIGAAIAYLATPLLTMVSHVPLELPFFSDPKVLLFLVGTFVGVTILAGAYPSLLLSGYQPMVALRKNTSAGKSSGNVLRKSLVVAQFAIAQALIIGAMVTILQMDFIQNKDLGFQNDLVYTFSYNNDSTSMTKHSLLKQRMLQIPTVEAVSLSSDQPLSGNTWSSNFRYADRPEDEPYSVTLKFCDEDYQKTYGIRLLAGEWYAPSDTMRDAVINLTLAKRLGIQNPQEAVGQKIRIGGRRILNITGVTNDFHTHSFQEEHLPLLMTTRKRFYWETGIKIRPDQIASSTQSIQKVFDEVFPEQVFFGNFLDERIARHYEDEQRMTTTSKVFGLLAILISCLGLFGLATHAATQRIKEIGIRKVLGSSIAGIVRLLSADFIKLVVVALLIAIPSAYYVMGEWLDNFVYRIELNWGVFVLAGILTTGIAFVTVSFQSVKAALANPVDSLKNE